MSKITLTDLVNLENETTAVNAINANSTVIQTAFDNTLSRDGTAPNQMQATLDMNSNQIINLPSPATVNSPARLIDVTSNPTIVIPATGISGHVVPYLDGNNTYSGTATFTNTVTLPANSITNSELATMAADTVKGSVAGGTPADLTQTQLTSLVKTVTSATAGVVPAFPNNTTTFFRGDGTYASPSATVTLPFINSLNYGLVGDGVTNDYPAMQNFLNALAAAGGVGVLAPGKYMMYTTPSLAVADGVASAKLLAYGATILTNPTAQIWGFNVATVQPVTREDEARHVVIEGLHIDHFANTQAIGGMQINNVSTRVTLNHCIFNAGSDSGGTAPYANYECLNFNYGTGLNGNYWCRVINCSFHGAAFFIPYGIVLTGQQNSVLIDKCDFANITNVVVFQGDPSGNLSNSVVITNNAFEGCTTCISEITMQSSSSLAGMIASYNRMESCTTFFSYTCPTNTSWPPVIGPNIKISVSTYLSNPNGFSVTQY